jgi:hypothetical protein
VQELLDLLAGAVAAGSQLGQIARTLAPQIGWAGPGDPPPDFSGQPDWPWTQLRDIAEKNLTQNDPVEGLLHLLVAVGEQPLAGPAERTTAIAAGLAVAPDYFRQLVQLADDREPLLTAAASSGCQLVAWRSQKRSWRQVEMKLVVLPLLLSSMKPSSRSSLTPVASSSGAASAV